jgi:hypothetical protein
MAIMTLPQLPLRDPEARGLLTALENKVGALEYDVARERADDGCERLRFRLHDAFHGGGAPYRTLGVGPSLDDAVKTMFGNIWFELPRVGHSLTVYVGKREEPHFRGICFQMKNGGVETYLFGRNLVTHQALADFRRTQAEARLAELRTQREALNSSILKAELELHDLAARGRFAETAPDLEPVR